MRKKVKGKKTKEMKERKKEKTKKEEWIYVCELMGWDNSCDKLKYSKSIVLCIASAHMEKESQKIVYESFQFSIWRMWIHVDPYLLNRYTQFSSMNIRKEKRKKSEQPMRMRTTTTTKKNQEVKSYKEDEEEGKKENLYMKNEFEFFWNVNDTSVVSCNW